MPRITRHAIDRMRQRFRHGGSDETLREQLENIFHVAEYSHETRDRAKIYKAHSLVFCLVNDTIISVWDENEQN